MLLVILLRRRHQEVGGGWRHWKTGRSRWNWLAAAQEGHDVAAETLVVVGHVQLAAAVALVAAGGLVGVVFLKENKVFTSFARLNQFPIYCFIQIGTQLTFYSY